MANKLDVIWSNESVRSVDQIIKFLNENWTTKEVEIFLIALAGFEEIVSRFPEIYPKSLIKKGYRKAVILKQISIIYSVEKNTIKIHTLFDNRQDPAKLK
jgi:plasmid stabilization system protein ParE